MGRRAPRACTVAWLAAVALTSCRSREAVEPVDLEESSEQSAKVGLPKRFPRFAELASLREVSRLRSAHPVGDLAAVVKVDRLAEPRYGKTGQGAMPEGAMIAEALGPDPEGPPVLFYVMERRAPGYFPEGGDWEYAVVAPDGTTKAGGKLALCARCHAEAHREHLFERAAKP